MAERLTPERRMQRTRDALLEAAISVFAKRGFHGASLDEIAESAGYTRGAIYKHFADKEELLNAACGRLNERVIAEFDAVPSAATPLEQYQQQDVAAVAEEWRHLILDREFVAVMLEYQLYAIRNPEARVRARAFAQANQQRIATYIRALTARTGEHIPIAIEDLAGIFGIASDGFSQARLIDDDAARLFELFLSIFIRGLQAMIDEQTA
ncbi:MAG TPA: TetR family transcriptional regulator [Acidimicrobiia bacterium]